MSDTLTLGADPTIEAVHNAGVGLLKTDTAAADEQLRTARNLLPQAYEGRPEALILHSARLERDLGQSALREAINGMPTSEMSDQDRQNAIHNQARLVGDAAKLLRASENGISALMNNGTDWSEADRARLNAEYGATLSWQARRLLGKRAIGFPQANATNGARELFDHARLRLKIGDNLYYETSNNMHAARFEASEGNVGTALTWLGRAAVSIGLHAIVAPKDSVNSLRTAFRLGKDIALLKRRKIDHTIQAGGI